MAAPEKTIINLGYILFHKNVKGWVSYDKATGTYSAFGIPPDELSNIRYPGFVYTENHYELNQLVDEFREKVEKYIKEFLEKKKQE